jgi:asparagine synthase (glutamine-hydrolysing)
MCGIAGILTARADLEIAAPLQRMLSALRHRGPDDEGWEEIPLPGGLRLGLANTRLAILDLSAAGHQPMADAASGSWIVQNGEVYNHECLRRAMPDVAFRSGSDTETMLRGWVEQGPRILESFRGMFALALYDGRRRQFWLVRDRLGVKPLYVGHIGKETWLFASELRALAASELIRPRIDPRAVNGYLTFGAVPAPWTLFDGVESLLPGECWRFDIGSATSRLVPERRRYWRPSYAAADAPVPERKEAVETLRRVLVEAVNLRTVADVPVAVFLSGGIDSSSVVAALASAGQRVNTFTVVFGERNYDESAYARLVARHFGTAHEEVLLRPAEVLEQFEDALRGYDQPSIDGVNTYFVSQATRRAGIKVALSGVGGDELFAGYPTFRLLRRLERPLVRHGAQLAYQLLRWLAPDATRTRKLGAILRGRSRLEHNAICREVLGRDRRAGLFARPANAEGDPIPAEVRAELEAAADTLDPVNAQSLLELSLYMTNMLLRDADQMSMAHSLEVREPLLDHVLVEQVARLPGALKLAGGRAKALLVESLPTELPAPLLGRRKMGFVFPWECWLRHELRDRVGGLLGDADAVEAAGLAPRGVRQLWEDFLASRPGIRYTDILGLVHLLFWTREQRVRVPAACIAG